MPDNDLVQSALENTIQSQYGKAAYSSPISLMMLLAKAHDIVSPWWSKRRDLELGNLVKSSDHLSGAVFNMCAKMTAIPIRVEARDKSVKAHVKLAEQYTDMILHGAQFGEGWAAFYSRMIEDLITQDNGCFAEIIGPGNKDGPLTGPPISIAHLDSSRCNRTGSAEYPVIYEDIGGRRYMLHHTRVMYMTQMPSTRAQMFGVGFCSVSRALNAAQNLTDMSIYKQEKLGSRPARKMMVTGGGLDPEDIQLAAQMAEREMSNIGLSRFSKTIVAGNRNILDPKVQEIDMTSMEDFDEKESTILAMAVLAMAFGMDARELFPVMDSGATKADAIVQHMKQRGKGPGQIIEMTEKQLDTRVLPYFLKSTFDYQDDAQDRQVAEIRGIRSQARQRDLLGFVTNPRTERQLMVENGEISREQFTELELADGRLEDGLDVEVLFASEDQDYVSMLGGVTDANADDKIMEISTLLLKSKDAAFIAKARKAIAAIKQKFIKPREEMMQFEQQLLLKGPRGTTNQPGQGAKKPDDSYADEKMGRKLGRDEAVIRGDMQRDI